MVPPKIQRGKQMLMASGNSSVKTRRIILGVVAVLIGALYHSLFHPEGKDLFLFAIAEILIALIIELCFLVEEAKEETLQRIEKTAESIRKVEGATDKLFNEINMSHTGKLASFQKKLSRFPSLEKLGSAAIVRLENSLSMLETGFEVGTQQLALETCGDFWGFLVEEQFVRKAKVQSALKVCAIHSCSFQIWIDNPYTSELLKLQEEFMKQGGNISRILCGVGLPSEEARRAYSIMVSHGIPVKYYNINTQATSYPFTGDFAFVEGIDVMLQWNSTSPNREIFGAQYLATVPKKEKADWKNIDDAAKTLEEIDQTVNISR